MTKTTDLTAARQALDALCGTEGTAVLAAVSGGMDSMCLLHLLCAWGREKSVTVTAAHFNHRLRGECADRDEAFVRDWCAAHDVPFVCGGGDVRAAAEAEGKSIEEAARDLRYAFLEQQRRALGCAFLLTAHHADDSAETQLLHLIRGTGLRGLTGIPAARERIARPFLRVTKEELARYAADNGVPYIEDETNFDPDAAARNLIRLRVMPLLKELNPRAVENMARTAELLARDENVLDSLAETLLDDACRVEGETAVLDAERCLAAEPAVLCRAVLALLAQMAGRRKDLTARHAEDVCGLLGGAQGKTISLPYGLTARREAHSLVIAAAPHAPAAVPLVPGETARFGAWRISLSAEGPGTALCLPEGASVTVTAWRREDGMSLPGSRGKRSLKRLCAERGIIPAERDVMPVLRVDGKLAAVPGVGVDLEFMPREDAAGGFIMFEKTEENLS